LVERLDPGERAARFFPKHLRHNEGSFAGKPFVLLPWQDKIIRDIFGTVDKDGKRVIRESYVEVGKKNGKALDVGTLIPTPSGFRRMADLETGDYVFDERGEPTRITATTGTLDDRPTFFVEFSDGAFCYCDAEHEWVTWSLRDHSYGRRTTKEIFGTLGNRADGAANHSVDIAGAIKCPVADLPIGPYTLGAWLGDGTTANAGFTCHSDDIAEIGAQIERDGYAVAKGKEPNAYWLGSGGRSQSARNRSLQAKLRAAGLLGNKHIPGQYLWSSVEQRTALLQGLMDTDGYASVAGQCEFTSTRRELADGFLHLVRSLGFKASQTTGRATLQGRDCGPKYRIQFWAFSDRPVFQLLRKRRRQKARPNRKARSETRQITRCCPVDSTPVKCIEVEAASGQYLATEHFVPTHNSELAAGVALYLLFGDGEPGAQVYSAAATRDQAGIVFRIAAAMVRRNPELLSLVNIVPSSKLIILKDDPTSFYKAISADAGNQDGINPHGVIFDELHRQKNRDLWNVLTYGSDTRDQPLLFAITTAGITEESELCWEQHERARQQIEGVTRDKSFYPVIYASGEKDDWTDPKTWLKANPSMEGNPGGFMKLDRVRSTFENARVSPAKENEFRRYRLSQWVAQESRWLQMEKWDACGTPFNPEVLVGRTCYAGLDLSSRLDVTALVLAFEITAGELGEKGIDPDTQLEALLPFFWLPGDGINQRKPTSIGGWAKRGLIETTEGDLIDYDAIKIKLRDLRDVYDIREVGYDRWRTALTPEGVRRADDRAWVCQGTNKLRSTLSWPRAA